MYLSGFKLLVIGLFGVCTSCTVDYWTFDARLKARRFFPVEGQTSRARRLKLNLKQFQIEQSATPFNLGSDLHVVGLRIDGVRVKIQLVPTRR